MSDGVIEFTTTVRVANVDALAGYRDEVLRMAAVALVREMERQENEILFGRPGATPPMGVLDPYADGDPDCAPRRPPWRIWG